MSMPCIVKQNDGNVTWKLFHHDLWNIPNKILKVTLNLLICVCLYVIHVVFVRFLKVLTIVFFSYSSDCLLAEFDYHFINVKKHKYLKCVWWQMKKNTKNNVIQKKFFFFEKAHRYYLAVINKYISSYFQPNKYTKKI